MFLRYRDILNTTVVAISSEQEELPNFDTFDQVSQQRELLLRVVQVYARKNVSLEMLSVIAVHTPNRPWFYMYESIRLGFVPLLIFI